MRPFWFIVLVFLLIGINAACRTDGRLSPEQLADGCTRMGSGLIHCPATTRPEP